MQLSGNTVLITGGSSGIGYALAEAFLKAGSTVLICGHNEQRLQEARAKRGNFKAGLGAEEFVAAVMKGLAADIPEIGYGMTAGFIHASREELDRRFREMNSRM